VPELSDAQALMDFIWDPEVVEQKQVTLFERLAASTLVNASNEPTWMP
jgi:hypothetical protein